MKYLLILTLPLFAADAPKPFTHEKELLRAALSEQFAQVQLLQYREQPSIESAALRTLEARVGEASKAWAAALAAAQKADEAEACKPQLFPDAKWVCEVAKK